MSSWQAPPSFADYVRERHVALVRFARLLCGDSHLADDLVQDALVRSAMRWGQIERQDDPEAYLRRAIVNGYLNRRRKQRRETVSDTVADHIDADPRSARAAPEPADTHLWHLLTTLPRQQRAVLVLRYYEDLSEAQIAEVLGCSTGTVKSNASRAMAKLRAGLGVPAAGTDRAAGRGRGEVGA